MKRMLQLFVLIVSVSAGADESAYHQVRDQIFWKSLYARPYVTLYCGVPKPAGEKVTVEHVYPASWIADAQGCKDRNTCPVDIYRQASSDLHNLWPALGRYNSSRGNAPFTEIAGEKWRWPECDFEKNSTGVEPRESVRGEIARSFLYMIDRYQLPDHGQRALMLKWNRDDPVSDEEIQRNREIYLLQGVYNKYISQPIP